MFHAKNRKNICHWFVEAWVGCGSHHVFARPSRASRGLLRLRLHERRQQLLPFLVSEGQVSVGVQAEHLGPVYAWEGLDESDVVLHLAGRVAVGVRGRREGLMSQWYVRVRSTARAITLEHKETSV